MELERLSGYSPRDRWSGTNISASTTLDSILSTSSTQYHSYADQKNLAYKWDGYLSGTTTLADLYNYLTSGEYRTFVSSIVRLGEGGLYTISILKYGSNYTTYQFEIEECSASSTPYMGRRWVGTSVHGSTILSNILQESSSYYTPYVSTNDLLDLLYPIGSIYISYTQNDDTANTTGKYGCPIADTLGGSWKRIEGRFLVSIGSNGSSGADALTITVDPNEPSSYTGGAATHTLQKAELPSYTIDSTNKVLTGAFEIRDYGASGSFDATLTPKAGASGGTIITKTDNNGANVSTTFLPQSQNTYKRTSVYVDARHTHLSGGSDQPFNIIPPYLAVYMWKRTA